MIKGFRHKRLTRLYESGQASGLPPELVRKLERVLTILDVATAIESIRLPGLHPLQGDLKGVWSVAISANWRLVFRIDAGNVHDVDFLDYH
jgi:toxin HigB-1